MTGGAIRLTHVITGLAVGGAELTLYRLLSALDRKSFDPQVICLLPEGEVAGRIRSLGIPVRSLGLRFSPRHASALWRLRAWLQGPRPHVVQTWMYHADLLGGLAAKWAGLPVLWSARQSHMTTRMIKPGTIAVAKLCAFLSGRVPEKIICNSQAAARAHAAFGYRAEKMVVIPNAFDTSLFKPDPAARAGVRRELGLPEDALLIGMFGRLDPLKGHPLFLESAGKTARRHPGANFILCGPGVTSDNAALAGWVRQAGLEGRCRLLGSRDDMPRLAAALDVYVLSSAGEGFPNALGEAMACGVSCAATDVGDAAVMLGDAGRVVPPGDSGALAEAVSALVELGPEGRARMGAAARRRVEENFGLPAMVAKYEALYREAAGR